MGWLLERRPRKHSRYRIRVGPTAGEMTVAEAGRKGGVKTRDVQTARDPKYYSKLG